MCGTQGCTVKRAVAKEEGSSGRTPGQMQNKIECQLRRGTRHDAHLEPAIGDCRRLLHPGKRATASGASCAPCTAHIPDSEQRHRTHRRMQDLAREVADLLEPTEPLGHRLVVFSRQHSMEVVFEAKAVRFRGNVGFLARFIEAPLPLPGQPLPGVDQLAQAFAPSEDALKYLIRRTLNLFYSEPVSVLMPAAHRGHDRTLGQAVDFGLSASEFVVGDADSRPERALHEAVAALTLLKVPAALKW